MTNDKLYIDFIRNNVLDCSIKEEQLVLMVIGVDAPAPAFTVPDGSGANAPRRFKMKMVSDNFLSVKRKEHVSE